MLCQRCGRTICPECQIPAAVGVHCPECVREQRAAYDHAQRSRPGSGAGSRMLRRVRGAASAGRPVVTYAIIAVCVLAWLFEIAPGIGPYVQLYGLYQPRFTDQLPWTMLTSVFLHFSWLHIGLNMLSLFFIGPALEQMLGRWRYLAVFLIAGFGGSVAVLLLAPGAAVAGASGAIFGLMGAYFIIARHLGGNGVQILVVVGLNLAIGLVIGSVSWQAHVGGLIAGAAAALVLVNTRSRTRRGTQIAGLAGIVTALIAISAVGYAALY
ncbi:rhomboid family intramembrane serine protease [Galbitalea sp. SE-J8]|uniref:rhomboid family intramembrane serine protease n=1 Tax=Galbitalea sp. SE-J8 TaxID=3054952 RepID=UPI00259CEC2B|nr:rhomboid family intramembrane serine protease [Galbitalea sp. SE-J8]MDM4763275.1 rhomboid family intramembrane serine protease [Galbitalea sp. SE-J8]